MIKKMYYDKKGKQIEMMDWAKKFEDREYKVIKQETMPDGKWVSTVWLGLDHSFDGGKPLIFETMVFPKQGDYMDEVCERYSTLNQAIKGHKKIVEKYNLC